MAVINVKCPLCGQTFDRNSVENVKVKRRYYHKECYEKIEKDLKEKDLLEEYIKELFKIEELSLLMKRQINEYHEEKKYSYSGIRKTLYYFFEVKHNDIGKSKGIGIVPYVYDEAYNYFYSLAEIKEKVESAPSDLCTESPIEVTIDLSISKPMKKRKEIKINSERRESFE